MVTYDYKISYNSTKSKDIDSNAMVAANFFWGKLEKQGMIKLSNRGTEIFKEHFHRLKKIDLIF